MNWKIRANNKWERKGERKKKTKEENIFKKRSEKQILCRKTTGFLYTYCGIRTRLSVMSRTSDYGNGRRKVGHKA